MLRTRLKELRAEKRVTQEQLAEAVGVDRSSIGKYEGNQNIDPSVEVLIAMADYFGVTTDYLLGFDRLKTVDVTGLTDSQVDLIVNMVSELKK